MDNETRQGLERDAHFSYKNLVSALVETDRCLEHHLGIITQLLPANHPAVSKLQGLQDEVNSILEVC